MSETKHILWEAVQYSEVTATQKVSSLPRALPAKCRRTPQPWATNLGLSLPPK